MVEISIRTKINPANRSHAASLQTIVAAYLDAQSLGEYQALANLLSSDPDDTGIKDFMDFWWSASSCSETDSGFAVGPLEIFDGMPTATLVYFDLSATFTDWRSLFVSYHSESFSVCQHGNQAFARHASL